MDFPNLESLVATVDVSQSFAYIALPENNGRRLLEHSSGSSTSNRKLSTRRSRIRIITNCRDIHIASDVWTFRFVS